VVDRWQWVYRAKSGRTAWVSDTGTMNVRTRRPHLVPPAAREEAADTLADFDPAAGFDHEQRLRIIWG
jgi:hypothetical protein